MSWRPPVPLGYLESIQAVGGFAAPLLAGGSFTMAVLALQSSVPGPSVVSRWPNAALALFITAGLLQIATVQATAWTRRYTCTPEDLLQWFPGDQIDGAPDRFLTNMQASHLRQAYRWAGAARGLFHAGVVALVCGLLVTCVPHGQVTGPRWAVIVVCAAGVVGELLWLVRAVFLDRGLRREAWPALGVPVLIAAVVIASVVVEGRQVRVAGAVVLLLCLLLCLLPAGRSVVSVVSLGTGAAALMFAVPAWIVAVVLLPVLVLRGRMVVDLTRRQLALSR
ncbi:hypothetical protein [Actinomadura algeriensis]|uniref:Uncharacterized protein n=1 Tax=Actinomadura algeriensis TaxID=1679523 RepID=A0ABR9JYD1_9ACTN|nr:hypothetical protein [Actinomadura algeriensis]MBE1535587.1 hypothetical protein [Actinomadura algeriensis]